MKNIKWKEYECAGPNPNNNNSACTVCNNIDKFLNGSLIGNCISPSSLCPNGIRLRLIVDGTPF